MTELITLGWFHAQQNRYHIYRPQGSKMDGKSHYHDYYQVCYVVNGTLLHQQDGASVFLNAGDAFIVPPGFIHSLHFETPGTEVFSLAFLESLFHPGFPQSNAHRFLSDLRANVGSGGNNAIHMRVELDHDRRKIMEGLLESLILQQKMACTQDLSAAPSIIAAIIYLLAQSYYAQPQNADALDTLQDYGSTLLRCVAYIDSHYKEELTLAALTKRFGISKSAFCSVFPQFVGMPLKKYIARKRIQEAQTLIRFHPEWSLNRISAEVGYSDDSTFYRNFLRVAGVTPSQYRAQCAHDE